MAQSLPQFVNPGDAAGQALTDFLVQQQQMKQQKLLNDVAQQRLQLDREREVRLSKSEELTIAEQRFRNKRLEAEAEKSDILDYRNELVPGDFVDPAMMTRAQKAGIALPSQKGPDTVVPAQPDTAIPGATMPSGTPAPSVPLPGATEVRTPGGVKFLGTPKQRNEQEAKQKIQAMIDTLPPGSPERLDLEYFNLTGRNAPASLGKTPGATTDTDALFRVSPRNKKVVERFQNGEWIPYQGGDLPKGSKLLQETAPPAGASSGPIAVFTMGPDGKLVQAGDMPHGSRVVSTPGATQDAARAKLVKVGVAAVDRVKSDIEKADEMGLIGPASGRLYQALAKVGTTGDKAKDELIGRLKSDILLMKMHVDAGIGGTRAASSPLLLKNWEDIALSGSKDLLSGYVGAIHDDMTAGSGDTPASGGGSDLYQRYLAKHGGK